MNLLINPLARIGKNGWYNTFRKHVTISTSSTNSKLVLLGDSVIVNFDKCNNIFDKFFLSFPTLNFGIGKDKTQNVLRVLCSTTLPESEECVIIHCGTNNFSHNNPLKIEKSQKDRQTLPAYSGRTLYNRLYTEIYRDDNLHLNRKGYEKLSKLFIGKIESLQITLQPQNFKASRNHTEGK